MICSQCQRDNPGDAAFCAGCGQKMGRLCPGCERLNDADATFCNGCGSSIAEALVLIEGANAKALAPRPCEWRAELAGVLGDHTLRKQLLEAEASYREIGAPLRAERIAKELAS